MRRFGWFLSTWLWEGQGALTHSSVWRKRLLGITLRTSAVLGWPWLLSHLPSHLSPHSLVFVTSHWLPQSPYCVAMSPPKPHIICCPLFDRYVHITSLPLSIQCRSSQPSQPSQPLPPPPALILPSLVQGHIWKGELLSLHPSPLLYLFTDGLLIWSSLLYSKWSLLAYSGELIWGEEAHRGLWCFNCFSENICHWVLFLEHSDQI